MFLRSIQLRDWKAYASGQFDFPIPTKNKNVVLIGAKNGYGKTSLLEAIILGLYGRDGMHALARAVTSNSDEDKSYDDAVFRLRYRSQTLMITLREWAAIAGYWWQSKV